MKELIKKAYTLDYRSLALYRVLLGLIIMIDVSQRLVDLTDFYSDQGLIPRSLFTGTLSMPWSFSLHLASGATGVQFIFFAIHFLFGLMLFFGFKTRLASIGVFVMTASMHNRNWFINNGGDDVLRAILFFSMFLPLGQVFSVDRAMRKDLATKSDGELSPWGINFLLQVFLIYFVSYILKDSPIWTKDFTAMHYSSRLDIFATPLGLWLRNFPVVLKVLTFFTIILEWIGPIVLIFPLMLRNFWWIGRMVCVLGFWALHIGIILTMNIGLFPFICMTMWTVFIPAPVWDKIFASFRKCGMGNLVIYFDEECNFCQKMCRLIRVFFLLPEVQILTAQSRPEILTLMKKHNSWVVKNAEGKTFFHFEAFVEVMRHSPILKYFVFLAPKHLGRRIYHWISNHRPLMGKLTQFLEYKTEIKPVLTLKVINWGFGVMMFYVLLMWNLGTIKKWGIKDTFSTEVTRWLHLYQEWNMFAPFPKTDNVWIEIPATLGDGSEIELMTGDKDIYSVKSGRFPGIVKNEHWRKFYLNVTEKVENAEYFAGFLCRKWNHRKLMFRTDTTLRKMEVIVYSQLNLIDGSKGSIVKKLSWKHWCFKEDFTKETKKLP